MSESQDVFAYNGRVGGMVRRRRVCFEVMGTDVAGNPVLLFHIDELEEDGRVVVRVGQCVDLIADGSACIVKTGQGDVEVSGSSWFDASRAVPAKLGEQWSDVTLGRTGLIPIRALKFGADDVVVVTELVSGELKVSVVTCKQYLEEFGG